MLFFVDPSRESDTYALPDAEVFHADAGEWWYTDDGERCDAPSVFCPVCEDDMVWSDTEEDHVCAECKREAGTKVRPCGAGFYWWYSLPGCLPDSEPWGPFDTEDKAIASAREQNS
jgi:hypothetical protein